MRWRAYPAYRKSGIEWLGEIPEHWTVQKLKHIATVRFSNVDKHTVDGEQPVNLCNYVDVYYNDFITADLDFMKATATPKEIAKFQLKKGDVIVTKDSESWDDIAVPAYIPSDLDGVLCGYHLAQIRSDAELVDGEYLFRSFCTRGLDDQFKLAATGITRYGLGKYWLDNSLFLVPPMNEQHAIAAFLDRETARIDALIEKKERQIKLLEEKRAALISHAVTKGLDPDVPLKESGVEWLGEIPAHWTFLPLKRNWQVTDCKHKTVSFIEEGIPIASIREVQGIDVDLSNAKMTTIEEYQELIEGGRKPKRGDIIYSRNATVGAAAFVDTNEEFCMGQDVCLISSKVNNQRFLVYQLRTRVVMNQLESLKVGATFSRINVAQIKEFLISCPPPEEQQEIADFCDKVFGQIEEIIQKITESIVKLREYRTALISAAVTGKIDVRRQPGATHF